MTKCEFLIRDKIFYGFKVTGHVGFDVKGKDVVCAAISALTQSSVIGLKDVMKLNVDYSIKDGFVECKIIESNECAQNMIKTLHDALLQLSKQYPKNVSFFEVEVK